MCGKKAGQQVIHISGTEKTVKEVEKQIDVCVRQLAEGESLADVQDLAEKMKQALKKNVLKKGEDSDTRGSGEGESEASNKKN